MVTQCIFPPSSCHEYCCPTPTIPTWPGRLHLSEISCLASRNYKYRPTTSKPRLQDSTTPIVTCQPLSRGTAYTSSCAALQPHSIPIPRYWLTTMLYLTPARHDPRFRCGRPMAVEKCSRHKIGGRKASGSLHIILKLPGWENVLGKQLKMARYEDVAASATNLTMGIQLFIRGSI